MQLVEIDPVEFEPAEASVQPFFEPLRSSVYWPSVRARPIEPAFGRNHAAPVDTDGAPPQSTLR